MIFVALICCYKDLSHIGESLSSRPAARKARSVKCHQYDPACLHLERTRLCSGNQWESPEWHPDH